MPNSPHAHADAVTAVEKWLSVSKQTSSLGASAGQFVDDLRNNQKTREWSKVNVELLIVALAKLAMTAAALRDVILFL